MVGQDILLSLGEHYEFKTAKMVRYTIGNRDAVSHKHSKRQNTLLVKGKRIGFTELIIWRKRGIKEKYRIYILSKKEHLKIIHLVQTFRSMGLKANMTGPLITVSGVINNFLDYSLIKQTVEKNKNSIHTKVELSQKLRNQIIGKIYKNCFDSYIDNIICAASGVLIECSYSFEGQNRDEVIKNLTDHFHVRFIKNSALFLHKNYHIKLKIVQMERLDGEELQLGLDQLSGSIDELFFQGPVHMIKKNEILLSQRSIHISTLAEPETVLGLSHLAKIEMGAEVPFKIRPENQRGQKVIWKFAGLKIGITLNKSGGIYSAKVSTTLTRPSPEGGINGSKNSTVILLQLKRPIKLFQIGLKTDGKYISQFPLLSKIPLLGELFKSKSKQTNYKKITGIIMLEKRP